MYEKNSPPPPPPPSGYVKIFPIVFLLCFLLGMTEKLING